MIIPEKYKELVGTKQSFSGGLFSGKVDLPLKEYDVLDIRLSSAQIVNCEEMRTTGKSSYKHPAFELLLKTEGMKRSRWTRPFAIQEINLNDLK
ncbi:MULTISPECIES: hypothetical protein [Sphingobacterium]|uniref:hypothetical protein n=1 Tax=Sphingobacterium TaxID=28453 RepID=UPI00257CCBB1|nr:MULTISPECIES: hypothetical protein [Sphingobacterium]